MSLFNQAEASTDEWATPQKVVRPLSEAVGGFDLDSASGAESEPHADHTYTQEDNGLRKDWFGKVWCNPPFSNKTKWMEKALVETRDKDAELVVMCLPVDTSTQWFHKYAVKANLLCFAEGRIAFKGDGEGTPNFGCMFVVWGDCTDELRSALHSFGVVFDCDNVFQATEPVSLEAFGGAD